MNVKEPRLRVLCDPEKTKLGDKNVDYETAEQVYKETIIKRSEKQTSF